MRVADNGVRVGTAEGDEYLLCPACFDRRGPHLAKLAELKRTREAIEKEWAIQSVATSRGKEES